MHALTSMHAWRERETERRREGEGEGEREREGERAQSLYVGSN
jgi:hypothetical protein